MNGSTPPGGGPTPSPPARAAVALALLSLAGVSLRLAILAVPPLVPLIGSDLHLSGAQVGLLVTLPTALFAAAAIPGSLLIARLGTVWALAGGLLVAAAGAGLRAFSRSVPGLYAATALMGSGVAVMHPALPALVREWLPTRIALGTAVYTTGLLAGEILPVALTLPFVLPWVGGDWTLALAAWSIPTGLTALLVAGLAPLASAGRRRRPDAPVRWQPEWRSPVTWLLGTLLGSTNAAYFSVNAFLPVYLASRGRPELVSGALTALNLGQLPAALLMLAVAPRLERRAWPFAVSAALGALSLAGLLASAGPATHAWAAALGFAVSAAFILALTLPPLLEAAEDVARTSAGMFAISYSGALAVGVASGAAADMGGNPAWAFAPTAACTLALAATAALLRKAGRLR